MNREEKEKGESMERKKNGKKGKNGTRRYHLVTMLHLKLVTKISLLRRRKRSSLKSIKDKIR